MIWRYSTGRGKPGSETAGVIHKLTRGRVSAATWASFRLVERSA